jgi:hypothetical protein
MIMTVVVPAVISQHMALYIIVKLQTVQVCAPSVYTHTHTHTHTNTHTPTVIFTVRSSEYFPFVY